MVHTVPVAAAHDAQIIRKLRHIGKEIAYLEPRLAAWPERLQRRKQRVLRDGAAGHYLSETWW